MSYSEWVKFVLSSFQWEEARTHDYYGYINWADPGDSMPWVGIDVFEDQIRVSVYYKTMMSYEEWGPSDRAEYEKIKIGSPWLLLMNRVQVYWVDGEDLNLLPWVIGLVHRTK